MKYQENRFTLDLQKHQAQTTINVFQGDTAVRLYISLTDGGKPYVLEQNSFAVFYGIRQDRKPLIHKCDIINSAEIAYAFQPSTTFIPGIVNCQCRIYTGNKELITAPRFSINVEEKVVEDDDFILSDDDVSALDEILASDAERNTAEAIREENERERITNELLRQQDENDRAHQESVRDHAETERQENEIDRVEAEQAREDAEIERWERIAEVKQEANAAKEAVNNINSRLDGFFEETSEAVDGKLTAHNTNDEAHNDIRLALSKFMDRVNTLLNSDDVSLDQLSEIVAYIKNNKDLIDGITTNKISVVDIIDNLTTNASDKPLSAKQGVVLKALCDVLSAGKVQKTAQTANRVAYVNDRGNESTVIIINDVNGKKFSTYTIACRNKDGCLTVNDPINPYDAVNKKTLEKMFTDLNLNQDQIQATLEGLGITATPEQINSLNDYDTSSGSVKKRLNSITSDIDKMLYGDGSKGLLYTFTGSGYALSGASEENLSKDVVIANQVMMGIPVDSVKANSLNDCETIESLTIPKGITSIGDSAFRYCTGLKAIYFNATAMNDLSSSNSVFGSAGESGIKVVIGKNVTKIPAYLFYGATVTTVEFEARSVCESIGNRAFYGCTSLESITIPDGVTSIGEYTFYNCIDLTSVTIPDSVTSIGEGAFGGSNSKPQNVYYKGSKQEWSAIIGADNFERATIYYYSETEPKEADNYWHYDEKGKIAVWETVFSKGLAYTFDNNRYVVSGIGDCTDTDIVIPMYYNNVPVTSIGDHAFDGCESLTSITIPDCVTSIGEYAFSECSSLKNITLSNSISIIRLATFIRCTALTSINIPDNVFSIETSAFNGCTNLTSVNIGKRVSSIGNGAFTYCRSLTSVTIPNSVTSIDDNAFKDCTSLTNVTIGYSVTSIGNDAFLRCPITNATIPTSAISAIPQTYLTYVTITSGDIPEDALLDCTTLESLVIGKNVTSVNDRAFKGCTNLAVVSIYCDAISFGTNVFRDCEKIIGVYIYDIADWCNIEFYIADSNPLYKGAELYLNNVLVKDLVIPDGVTKIAQHTFTGYSSLESVTIPTSVTSVGTGAFSSCSNLTDIYYKGTVTQWNAITIGMSNTYFTNATIHYNS